MSAGFGQTGGRPIPERERRRCHPGLEAFQDDPVRLSLSTSPPPPLENLEECNGWLYSLQLNVYRHVLESEYSLNVTMVALGQVHPENAGPVVVQVPRMEQEVELLLEDQVAMGMAWPDPLPGETAPFVLPPGNRYGWL